LNSKIYLFDSFEENGSKDNPGPGKGPARSFGLEQSH